MSFQKIHFKELSDLVSTFKVDPSTALNLYIKQTLEKKWIDVVGTAMCNHTRPSFFKEGVLTIIVVHETYRMELSFISEMILKNANRIIGSNRIYKLRYIIGTINHKFLVPKKKSKSLVGKENLLQLVEKEKDELARRKLIELIENM